MRARRQKEQDERAQRERKAREDADRREREKASREEERLRRLQEEQERAAREREELAAVKEPEGTSWKGFFTVALVLGVLLLGYWVMAPGANNRVTSQQTFNNSMGMEFILIPSGEFDMGDSRGIIADVKNIIRGTYIFNDEPLHRIKLSKAFYMGKYEVTQKQWREVMGNNPSNLKGDNLPVERVSWNDAQEFIKKLNEKEGTDKYRLPSEAEWEHAARAGTTTKYFFGNDESKLGDYAWYDDFNGKTHEVGQKKPNLWGLYDIYGNVWEWVQDTWHNNYSGAPVDGTAWESVDESHRVMRGCAYYQTAWACRSAGRTESSTYDYWVGFRLVRDV